MEPLEVATGTRHKCQHAVRPDFPVARLQRIIVQKVQRSGLTIYIKNTVVQIIGSFGRSVPDPENVLAVRRKRRPDRVGNTRP